jgi:dolichol-phosphate mannosyltransferase
VLVIGANSFVARYFLSAGDAIGYSKSGPLTVDITDRKSIDYVICKEKPDVILNFATYGNLRSHDNWEQIWETNVVGTRNVLESLRSIAPEVIYVHIGSYSEYGLTHQMMKEDQCCTPVSYYGLAKLLASETVTAYWRVHGLKTVVLRITSVYGPGEQPERLFPTLFRCYMKNEPFTLWNSKVGRDFTWVGDVCHIAWKFADNGCFGRFGEIFNVSRGKQILIKDAVQTFQTVVGPLKIIDLGKDPEPTDSPAWVGDVAKLSEVINGYEFVGVEEGLRMMNHALQ